VLSLSCPTHWERPCPLYFSCSALYFSALAMALAGLCDAPIADDLCPSQAADSGTPSPSDAQQPERQCPPPWHGPVDYEILAVTVERIEEQDAHNELLRGFRLGLGPWIGTDATDFPLSHANWYASASVSDRQQIYRLGLDVGFVSPSFGPFRFSPLFGVATMYRTQDPHPGLGLLGSIGAEATLWLGPYVQIGASAKRLFELPSGTKNQVALILRFPVHQDPRPGSCQPSSEQPFPSGGGE
jgi:hypothetical protein